jgi:hypothetical protein
MITQIVYVHSTSHLQRAACHGMVRAHPTWKFYLKPLQFTFNNVYGHFSCFCRGHKLCAVHIASFLFLCTFDHHLNSSIVIVVIREHYRSRVQQNQTYCNFLSRCLRTNFDLNSMGTYSNTTSGLKVAVYVILARSFFFCVCV